jgi:nicotinate phosphoribosyltransferase
MAYGYWASGRAAREAAFHLYFRTAPFGGGYAVACGMDAAPPSGSTRFRFAPEELAYLATLPGADGVPPLSRGVPRPPRGAAALARRRHGGRRDGGVPRRALVRVRGPILQAQLAETALLTHVGFPTLVATKAARICSAARGDAVLEFGLRRAQGPDGGLTASRAAYVGGCAATSNVLAGLRYGIPVGGTHAHSWVMSFDDELASFEAYADALPNNCVFLVDTYDTLDGVRHAVQVGERLRARGHRLLGVRLDSGDLAYLSKAARRILDAAGFPDAQILASNDLDEHVVESLKLQGAQIAVWGVGHAPRHGVRAARARRRVQAHRDARRGRRVAAAREGERAGGQDDHARAAPGPPLRAPPRANGDGTASAHAGDMLVDELEPPPDDAPTTMVDPFDPTRRKRFAPSCRWRALLEPVFRDGVRVRPSAPLAEARERAARELGELHDGVRRFVNPHRYPVGSSAGCTSARRRSSSPRAACRPDGRPASLASQRGAGRAAAAGGTRRRPRARRPARARRPCRAPGRARWPAPVPSLDRARVRAAAVRLHERLEDGLAPLAGMPGPVSLTVSTTASAASVRAPRPPSPARPR